MNPAFGFHAESCGEESRRIWQCGEHALIGISTGNSYFTQERLAGLLQWAAHFFAEIDVLYVDTHIDTRLRACGYTPEHASRLATRRVRDVRRRVRRAVEFLEPAAASRVRVHPLSDFLDRQPYLSVRELVVKAMDDEEFVSVCEDMVRCFVTAGSDEDNGDIEAAMRAGMSYLTAELPFFVDSPSIFGVSSSANCYHVSTPLVRYLTSPGSPLLRAAHNQGFMVVKPAEAGPGEP